MRVMVVALLLLVAGCSGLHSEGEQCRFGCSGTLACTPPVEPCEADLYCSDVTDACTAPREEGEDCDTNYYCAATLWCNEDSVCQAPGPDGAVCQSDAQCLEGLVCNSGYLPDDLGHGECHPLSDVGEPCAYTRYVSDGTGFSGCLLSLTCVPPTPTAETIAAGDDICPFDGPCGFAGVCAPLFSVPFGEACLGGGACEDAGNCNPLPLPYFIECSGADSDCYRGPWPGLCGPSDSNGPNRIAGWSCTDGPCAPGFVCDWLGTCQPRWHGGLFTQCGEYSTGVALDDFCQFPLTCVGTPAQCQVP